MHKKPGTIIRLFGADGVGKTTLTNELALHEELGGVPLITGTHPETWPDGGSYYYELQKRGKNLESSDRADILEKMQRCYALAGALATEYGAVIIDSDPFAKTIIYNYIQAGKATGQCPRKELVDQYHELSPLLTRAIGEASVCNVHVRLTEGGPHDRAAELMRRIGERGSASVFDPNSLDEASLAHRGANDLATWLVLEEQTVIQVANDAQFNPPVAELVQNIQQTYL